MNSRLGQPLFLAILGILLVLLAIALSSVFMVPTTMQIGAPSVAPSPTPHKETPPPQNRSAPTFDVVRVTRDGESVMAGRAHPGASVNILDGDRSLGRVVADDRGQWVFVPQDALAPGAHQLRLEVDQEGRPALTSSDDVIVLVPKPSASGSGPSNAKDEPALVLRLSRSGEGSATVLQSPHIADTPDAVVVDALDYKTSGEVRIFGRATPGARVRVYLDKTVLGETVVNSDGDWRLDVDRIIEQGEYTLSAVTIDDSGKAIAHTHVPVTAAPISQDETGPRIVIVEPGQNLWRIARYVYGSGPAYTLIYGANRDLIRNPNLIYPGQEFQLPDAIHPTAGQRTP